MTTEVLTIKDVDGIVKFFSENLFNDGFNKNQLISSFSSGNFIAVGIKDEGKTIAFIGVTIHVDSADIEDVLVDANYRKKGFAKSLILFSENTLKGKGVNSLFLEVRESNLPAISLYESLGYKKISQRKKYYSDGETALIYKKEI